MKKLLLLCVLAVLVGCGDDAKTKSVDKFSGTWSLTNNNPENKEVPFIDSEVLTITKMVNSKNDYQLQYRRTVNMRKDDINGKASYEKDSAIKAPFLATLKDEKLVASDRLLTYYFDNEGMLRQNNKIYKKVKDNK